jgi:hypothetical protein
LPHEFNFVSDLNSRKVDVGGWPTQLIGREQHASLKNKFTVVLRAGKAK